MERAFFWFGLCLFLVGAASRFLGVAVVHACHYVVCQFGGRPLTVDLLLLGLGAFMVFMARAVHSQVR